ncbi:tRNA pseudouridine32 synthase/23S rRNA pseudouridine746 synthase [Tepidimonas ignava]|uniref:Ribosomal large subunit pseudouridine synthase A n=1 Tax=Tepidimonas ignava TaxID=114249 RepID=A0A4V2UVC1_9BURK|nr:pseudouridine synthase [Tepidimonas ignava]TCS95197.1 tRNA pseudouridine32 synthase/23S rRNA pseudouridine746 synthase [Tepidimonas ignava]TSE19344.1 Ribosomal large subunit pseudouridine synthase A [Tepidimonas ignava]
MARPPKNPAIGLRDGLSPSCLALPRLRQCPWPTLLDCLAERLPRVPREVWLDRLRAGQVLDEHGRALDEHTPYLHGQRIYYWRDVPDEPPIPFEATVLLRDEHLLVVDKPHFLPVTPGGRHVRETLLVRLKNTLGLPELSPLHRIDRETAGLVVFSVRAAERDAYQRLFRERRVDKTYEAIAPWRGDLVWPQRRVSHLREDETAFYRMREAAPDEGLAPNSETWIEPLQRLGARGELAHYRLRPVTGKRHQLRVHMAALGLPIVGDPLYPTVRLGPNDLPDHNQPLQLLARAIAFDDPITGQRRTFTSQRRLDYCP